MNTNSISKSDLQKLGKKIVKGFTVLQDTYTYRRRYNEILEIEDRVYVRTMRTRFMKWEVKGYPNDYKFQNQHRKQVLKSAASFFDSIIKDTRYGKRNGKGRTKNEIH